MRLMAHNPDVIGHQDLVINCSLSQVQDLAEHLSGPDGRIHRCPGDYEQHQGVTMMPMTMESSIVYTIPVMHLKILVTSSTCVYSLFPNFASFRGWSGLLRF